jgi:penicillin amidase
VYYKGLKIKTKDMKTLKTILVAFLLLVIVVFIAALFLVSGIRNGALPQYAGDISIIGLNNDVTVYRDERGMPHIYAVNEHDLYFTTGYVTAQERLWQMDLIRRATTGRLAEVLGEDLVKTDHFLRSLDMTTKSKMILSNEDSAVIECLTAYADGVNAYIAAAGKKLPPEFRILNYEPDPWKLEDIANIIGYMGWDLAAGNLTADIFNYRLFQKLGYEKGSTLIPDLKAITSSVFPDFSLSPVELREAQDFISSTEKLEALGIVSFSGSNNWAVSGNKSETGKPIFSNDMHLGLSSPGIWMQMHQVIPGKLNVNGVLVPGEPFIVAGHNDKIAWGMTNLMVDDIDLFIEKINPDNQNQYFYKEEWHNMLVKNEIINIKGAASDTFQVKFTHRGPIVSGFRKVNDASLSMRWSGYDHSDELKGVYLLNRASDWDDFRTALSSFGSVSQNFAYADVEGNIGLNTGGGIPVRKGYGSIIRNGESSEFDWKGYVPFSQLPYSYNPENGYVSSANNKTVSDDYPYYISYLFYPPYRIGRIREMLEEKEKYGIDDFKRMITDQHSAYAKLLVPHILKLRVNKAEMSPAEASAIDLMADWDYEMNADMVAPAIFEFFRKSMAKNLLADELGELFTEMPERISDHYIYRIINAGADSWVDDVNTPEKESLGDIIKKSFSDCVNTLADSYGEDLSKWQWSMIHTITLEHPMGKVQILDKLFKLNSDQYGIGGSNHTVCPYSYGEGFRVTDGASERHIYNTADWDDSYTVIPTGASGVPASEFYLSQTQTYLEGKFFKDAFSENAVKAAAKYTLVLKPAR